MGRLLESPAGAGRRSGVVSFRVRGGAHAAAAAREELIDRHSVLPPSRRDEVLLLLTELVTNAVKHGGAVEDRCVGVSVTQLVVLIRVAVTDPGPGFEWRGPRGSRPLASGGYGLLLVDRITSRWGIERGQGSNTVWFELGLAS